MDQPSAPVRVVTGANRGIGLEIARALAPASRLIVVGRSDASARQARAAVLETHPTAQVDTFAADYGSLASVRTLAAELRTKFERLDSLIHNAAVVSKSRKVSSDGIELQLQVNHLAPFLLTALLQRPLERAGGRVVVVASEAHRRAHMDVSDLQFERRRYTGDRAYSQTKLANVMFTYVLSRRWWKKVSVNAVHPGVVSTPLLGSILGPLRPFRFLFRSAEAGAAPVVRLAQDESLSGVSGSYYRRFDAVKSSAASYDKLLQQSLWDASEELVGERFPD